MRIGVFLLSVLVWPGCLTQQMSLGQQASSRAFALLFYILYDLRDMLPLGLSVMLIAVEATTHTKGFHLDSCCI